jgi:hypothetical protein
MHACIFKNQARLREYFKLYKEFGECMMPFFLRGDNVNYL